MAVAAVCAAIFGGCADETGGLFGEADGGPYLPAHPVPGDGGGGSAPDSGVGEDGGLPPPCTGEVIVDSVSGGTISCWLAGADGGMGEPVGAPVKAGLSVTLPGGSWSLSCQVTVPGGVASCSFEIGVLCGKTLYRGC